MHRGVMPTSDNDTLQIRAFSPCSATSFPFHLTFRLKKNSFELGKHCSQLCDILIHYNKDIVLTSQWDCIYLLEWCRSFRFLLLIQMRVSLALCVFLKLEPQEEERRMASVTLRKEEEKKRESHKQTLLKVPNCGIYYASWGYPSSLPSTVYCPL